MKRLITLMALLLLVAFAIFHEPVITTAHTWFAAITPKVTRIVIEADFDVDKDKIITFLGVKQGSSMLSVPATRLRKRLEQLPQVREAKLVKHWRGDLVVTLKARTPVAVIADHQLALLDQDGHVFARVQRASYEDLPVVTGLETKTFDVNKHRPLLQSAASLTSTLTHTLGIPIDEVHIDNEKGFEVFSRELAGPIVMGLPPFEHKISRLKHILEKLDGRFMHIDFIDLDYNKRAFVRLHHPEQRYVHEKGW